MKIVKKINNNVALAQDARGHELVVFGKGIGFPATPYELDDLSKIQRTFYDVGAKNLALLSRISRKMCSWRQPPLRKMPPMSWTARSTPTCPLFWPTIWPLPSGPDLRYRRRHRACNLRPDPAQEEALYHHLRGWRCHRRNGQALRLYLRQQV